MISHLNSELYARIFRSSGNLSSIARVSKFFNQEAEKTADRIYCQLCAIYEKKIVQSAFSKLKISEKSSKAAKIDALFYYAALKQNRTLTDKPPYDLAIINGCLSSLIEANNLTILCVAIYPSLPAALKNKLKLLLCSYAQTNSTEEFVQKCHQFFKDERVYFSSVKALNLSGKNITRLPKEIKFFRSLEKLDLENNQIKMLPKQFLKLERLRVLNLANNPLAVLPKGFETAFPLLKFLCLTNYPDSILSTVVNAENAVQLVDLFLIRQIFNQPLERLENISPDTLEDEKYATYWQLDSNKWKEGVDGQFHVHGPLVFDQGLHRGSVEPGFYTSLLSGYHFLSQNFGRKIDATFYLELHATLCAHFDKKNTQTLIGKDKIGTFRTVNNPISASFGPPYYALTATGAVEFYALSNELSNLYGPDFNLGKILPSPNDPHTYTIYYHPMEAPQVRAIFNHFVKNFYQEVDLAHDQEKILRAIARLFQQLEWLHAPVDGAGRTDTALLNFLLTEYGFHPVLLKYPYLSSCRGLDEWVAVLKEGLIAWEDEATNLTPQASP